MFLSCRCQAWCSAEVLFWFDSGHVSWLSRFTSKKKSPWVQIKHRHELKLNIHENSFRLFSEKTNRFNVVKYGFSGVFDGPIFLCGLWHSQWFFHIVRKVFPKWNFILIQSSLEEILSLKQLIQSFKRAKQAYEKQLKR